MDNQWYDVWGICYGGRYCHAEYLTEAEAKQEFDRLIKTYADFDGEIVHIPQAGRGNMRHAGFGPFMTYVGRAANG